MAKKGFKMRSEGKKAGTGPQIDWGKINEQVEEGSHGARLVHLIDLGDHQDSTKLGDKGYTAFETEEEAEEFLEDMREKHGAKCAALKAGDPDIEEAEDSDYDPDKTKVMHKVGKGDKARWEENPDGEANWVIGINEYGGFKKNGDIQKYQEIALIADCTEMEIDYGDEIGVKPYRFMINRSWKGDVTGLQLKKVPPENKGDPWTVKGNTKLAEVINATGHKELLEVDLEDADLSEMLGEGFNISITKAGDNDEYVNIGKAVALKKKKNKETGKFEVEEVEELQDEPMCIMFDSATADELEAAHVRGDIIKKIKTALNYEGSQMQEAVEEYEERLKAKAKTTARNKADDEAAEAELEDEEEEKPKRKVTKAAPKTKSKAKSKSDEDEDEGEDDDEDQSEDWNS